MSLRRVAIDELLDQAQLYRERDELLLRAVVDVALEAASCLVLDRGMRFCFLYTDLANPTSNGIYMRIGYEPVCDSRELAFSPPSPD